jgi:hypothetical protein
LLEIRRRFGQRLNSDGGQKRRRVVEVIEVLLRIATLSAKPRVKVRMLQC